MPTARTRRLIAQDKAFVWHPFTQMRDWLADPEPLVISRGEGATLFDSEGLPYLDAVSSLWVTVHGHGHPRLKAALNRQMDKLDHSTLLGLANEPSIELAAALVQAAPKGLEKVFYSDSGSTAMEIALKIAFQYWQNQGGAGAKKKSFITLSQSYHGDTIGSVSLGGIGLFHRVYRPLLFKTLQVASPYGAGDPKEGARALAELEALLRKRSGQVAALVVEPLMQGAAGMLKAPPGFLRGLRRLCDRHDVLLIADEVATGFGRTGSLFACEQEGVSPDLMALAKGLTGGVLPLAATLATRRVYQGFLFPYAQQKTFFHGHTYTGNPLACAVALESLKLFKVEKTLSRLQPKIGLMAAGLERMLERPHVGEVRQVGFMAGLELMRDKAKRRPYAYAEAVGAKVCRRAREYGVILRPLGDVIVLMPPLCISLTELDFLLKVVEASIKDVTEAQG
ncbi:MAG TPA: adenosylmethionine--8-amino-7-oxononanoate transaminase [bacterium]|jgi:adenosylmethionine-8-amino-7-oxononanoate aminotransferase|nr:adenosylmethionine--8-amino-7-oxononanoate transaminase [bacterium]